MGVPRRFVLGVAALSTALMLPAAAAHAAAAPQDTAPQEYVALGDSFASLGSLTKLYTDSDGCLKSRDNYPARLADEINAGSVVDATCAGAKTGGVLDSQLDALNDETDLVTLTIGGNDIGFVDIVTTCARTSLSNPFGNPCQDHYTEGGTDDLADAINETRPKIDSVLTQINDRAPNAEVVVVGYLRIMPDGLGCWPLMPISIGDVSYINGVQDQLSDMIGASAAEHGATYVDPSTIWGHDACRLPWNRYVDGVLPLANGTPVHPTPAGQQRVAELVRDAL